MARGHAFSHHWVYSHTYGPDPRPYKKIKEDTVKETLYDAKFKILETRKKLNTVKSLIGGVVGGIIAILGGWAFWKGPPGP